MSCELCAFKTGQQKQTIFTGTYVQNRPHTEKPGKSSYPLPPEKTLRARHASYSARIELKPRRQVPDGLPVSTYLLIPGSVLAKSARTKGCDPKQTKNSQVYVYIQQLGGDVSQ